MPDKRKYSRKSAAQLRTLLAEQEDKLEFMTAEVARLRKQVRQSLQQTDAYTVMQWDCPNCTSANVEADSIEDGEAYICGECGDSVILNVV